MNTHMDKQGGKPLGLICQWKRRFIRWSRDKCKNIVCSLFEHACVETADQSIAYKALNLVQTAPKNLNLRPCFPILLKDAMSAGPAPACIKRHKTRNGDDNNKN